MASHLSGLLKLFSRSLALLTGCFPKLTLTTRMWPVQSAGTASALSTRLWKLAAGICSHSATRALVRLDTDVGGVPARPKGVGWG